MSYTNICGIFKNELNEYKGMYLYNNPNTPLAPPDKEIIFNYQFESVNAFLGFADVEVVSVPQDDPMVAAAVNLIRNVDGARGVIFLAGGDVIVITGEVAFFEGYLIKDGVTSPYNNVEDLVYDDEEAAAIIMEFEENGGAL